MFYGSGFGFRGGMGFGFRGSSPPWPYVGLGRGGLPRCWYPGLYPAPPVYGGYPAWDAMPYPPQMTPEQEVDFLREEANALSRQLEEIQRRIKELEVEEE